MTRISIYSQHKGQNGVAVGEFFCADVEGAKGSVPSVRCSGGLFGTWQFSRLICETPAEYAARIKCSLFELVMALSGNNSRGKKSEGLGFQALPIFLWGESGGYARLGTGPY